MSGVRRCLTTACAVLAVVVPVTTSASAQSVAPSAAGRFVVASDPATDLWFHTLALLDLRAPGTLPLYEPDYRRTIAAEKARRGIAPSALDREAPRLKRALTADSAFDVLHFLPLYLDRTRPEDLPALLRQIATPSAPVAAPEGVVQAIRAALASPRARAALIELADATDDEYRTFFKSHQASTEDAVAARRRRLQARWDDAFGPRLVEVFRAIGVSRGIVLLSPPLGPEGRVVRADAASLVIAVSDGARSASPDAPLLASIRELCFPLLERIWATDPAARGHAARDAAESGRAAVRCGAEVVDTLLVSSGDEYRRLFLARRPGESAPGYRRRFDALFRTDAETLRALARTIARGAPSSGALAPDRGVRRFHLPLPLGG